MTGRGKEPYSDLEGLSNRTPWFRKYLLYIHEQAI